MPLRLNLGLSRKIGESNYGSRGASINVEVEVESALVGDAAKLKDRIRQIYGLVRDSLAEELNGARPSIPSQPTGGNGQDAKPRGSQPRPATQSQVRALRAIASRHQIDLAGILRDRFLLARPDQLTLKDASALIDELKNGGG
jgi:hypothetical protein